MDLNNLVMPDPRVKGERTFLRRPISAVELTVTETGVVKLGVLSQLPAGVQVERCGDGFNGRTVAVRVKETCYFVFRQDLDLQNQN